MPSSHESDRETRAGRPAAVSDGAADVEEAEAGAQRGDRPAQVVVARAPDRRL